MIKSTTDVNKEVVDTLENILLGSNDIKGNVRPKYKDGTDAHTLFTTQDFKKYDLSSGKFYLPSLYHVPFKTAIRELRWIYQKQSNSLEDAHSLGVNWWDPWDVGDGTIGKRYGYTVKKYNLIDNLLEGLKNNPFSRRHIIDLYDDSDFYSPGLFPCAFLTMWSVREGGILDMTLIQRSSDYLVAGFINKLQYAVFQLIVAHSLGYKVGTFSHLTQNVHVYDRHLETLQEVTSKDVVTYGKNIYLSMKKGVKQKSFYEYTEDDFEVISDFDKPPEKLNLEIAI